MRNFIILSLLFFSNLANSQIFDLLRYYPFRTFGYYETSDIFGYTGSENLGSNDCYVLDKIKEYNNLSKKHNISKIIVNDEKYMYFNNNRLDSVVYRLKTGKVSYRYRIDYKKNKVSRIQKENNRDIEIYQYSYDKNGRLIKAINIKKQEEQTYCYNSFDRLIKYEVIDSGKIIMKDSICYRDSIGIIEVYLENLSTNEKFKNKFIIMDTVVKLVSTQNFYDLGITICYYFFNNNGKIIRTLDFQNGIRPDIFDYQYTYNKDGQLVYLKIDSENAYYDFYREYVYQYEEELLKKITYNVYNGNELQYQEIIKYKYEYEKQ